MSKSTCGFCGKPSPQITREHEQCVIAATEADWACLSKARELVNRQAEDDGLWFEAATAPEAYLQQELRKLHAAIEGEGTVVVANTTYLSKKPEIDPIGPEDMEVVGDLAGLYKKYEPRKGSEEGVFERDVLRAVIRLAHYYRQKLITEAGVASHKRPVRVRIREIREVQPPHPIVEGED